MAVIRRARFGGSTSTSVDETSRKRARRKFFIRLTVYPPFVLGFLLVLLLFTARRDRSLVDDVTVRDEKVKGSSGNAHEVQGTHDVLIDVSTPDASKAEQESYNQLQLRVPPQAHHKEKKRISSNHKDEKDAPASALDTSDVADNSTNAALGVSQTIEGWPPECGLYLAQSTIPNSGFGLFTAIDLEKDVVVGIPDVTIPVIDINFHNQDFYQLGGYHLLYENYFWSPLSLNGMAGLALSNGVMSHGFGALCNSHQGLNNLDEKQPKFGVEGLHRSRDPGAGGFSPFYGREVMTTTNIPAGAELFVDYGEAWFTSRADEIGHVPLERDYDQADVFIKTYHNFVTNQLKELSNEAQEDFYELVRNFRSDSRALNALPKTTSDLNIALESGVRYLVQEIKTQKWLKENGKCLDHIIPRPSTIKQAGRGAFATRLLKKGSLVSNAPLIHIPRGRDVFQMYEMNTTNAKGEYIMDKPPRKRGSQLMTNYAFGHPESSVYLTPYGPGVSFINHHREEANVRIRWGDPSDEWLNKSVDWLEKNSKSARLMFDFVATRDIDAGEEIFLNYGDEWQRAWDEHVETWTPPPGSRNYVTADKMNKNVSDHAILRTSKEQEASPYPENIQTVCRYRLDENKQIDAVEKEVVKVWEESHLSARLQPCAIRSRHAVDKDSHLYEVRILEALSSLGLYGKELLVQGVKRGQKLIIKAVPRDAIEFAEKMYTSDFLMKGAFRHEIIVADDVWPESWKDLRKAPR